MLQTSVHGGVRLGERLRGIGMDFLVSIGFVLLVAVIFVVFWTISRRLRVTQEVCPRCAHSVRGLMEPRCTECGEDLSRGVVRSGGIRPMPRRWFGALTVAVGLVSSVLALTLFVASWDSFLRMTGLLYLHVEFNRSVNVTIDQTNQLQVNTSGSYDKKNNVSTVTTLGQVEVVLSRNDKELAIWNGQGTIQNNPIKGVLVDGDQVVGVLRSQIPRDSDSPFAGIRNRSPVVYGSTQFVDQLSVGVLLFLRRNVFFVG